MVSPLNATGRSRTIFPYSQCAAAAIPAGAAALTVGVHTYVPAVTTFRDATGPRVMTCSGSRFGIDNTVYCQEPAQSGPVDAVGLAPASGMSDRSRRNADTTWAVLGLPAHATASAPVSAVGSPVGSPVGGSGGGSSLGSASGSTVPSSPADGESPGAGRLPATPPAPGGVVFSTRPHAAHAASSSPT